MKVLWRLEPSRQAADCKARSDPVKTITGGIVQLNACKKLPFLRFYFSTASTARPIWITLPTISAPPGVASP